MMSQNEIQPPGASEDGGGDLKLAVAATASGW